MVAIIIKQSLNQNALIIVDNNQEEFLLLGKGIGFNKKKGDTVEINEDVRKYPMKYNEREQKVFDLIEEIPSELILIVEETIEKVTEKLDINFDYSFIFTLASHIYYSLNRSEKFDSVVLPFDYGLDYIFPDEYEVAKWSVNYLRENHQLELSDSEYVFFTFHFVNGMEGIESNQNVINIGKIISDIIDILERHKGSSLDKDSLYFSRFIIHIRYFLIRQAQGKLGKKEEFKTMFDTFANNFYEAWNITNEIIKLLEDKYEYVSTYEENLYLLLHVQRLSDENA